MPTVPNWIAKAVVLTPTFMGPDIIQPTTHWRATNTQVIVQTGPGSGDLRFYLDTLTKVGSSKRALSSPRLVPPDHPAVITARREQTVAAARHAVLDEVAKQRLQDSSDDAEAAVAKLSAIRDAVDKALASLAEVL